VTIREVAAHRRDGKHEVVMSKKLILRADLKAKKNIHWSNKHLLELERRGLFPKRIYLGPQTPAWAEDEIDALVEAKFAERDAHKAA
jgi:predicted DNA-binding transcriptional regulator AlpA